ncbi:MAG TPA: GIY-YIG nuclease family protein [Gemmataceae bacterium]|jgi:hypothetical protein
MIYFLQEQRPPGFIKIGFTDRDVPERVAELQVGNPSLLVILCVQFGDEKREQDLHELFAADYVRGDWFRPSPDLVDFCKDLPPWPVPLKPPTMPSEEYAAILERYQR